MERLDIVHGIMRIPQGISRPGSRQIGLGSVKSQSNTSISGRRTAAEPDPSPLPKEKPVEAVNFHPCI